MHDIHEPHASARWTTTLAAAASIAVATSGFAQTAPPAQPPTQQPTAQAAPAANQDMAKQHLTAARNVLSEVTQLPAAAQLTGEARTQVQQLISNFNELITKDTEWRASYAKVEANLAVLLDATEPGAPRRARPAPSARAVAPLRHAAKLDPTIRARLIELRKHLDKFEAVVDGSAERGGRRRHPRRLPQTRRLHRQRLQPRPSDRDPRPPRPDRATPRGNEPKAGCAASAGGRDERRSAGHRRSERSPQPRRSRRGDPRRAGSSAKGSTTAAGGAVRHPKPRAGRRRRP